MASNKLPDDIPSNGGDPDKKSNSVPEGVDVLTNEIHTALDGAIDNQHFEPKPLSNPSYFTDKRYILEDLQRFAWKSNQGRNCRIEDLTYNVGNTALMSWEIVTAGGGSATGFEYLRAAAKSLGLKIVNERNPSASVMKEALLRLKILAGCDLGFLAKMHRKNPADFPSSEQILSQAAAHPPVDSSVVTPSSDAQATPKNALPSSLKKPDPSSVDAVDVSTAKPTRKTGESSSDHPASAGRRRHRYAVKNIINVYPGHVPPTSTSSSPAPEIAPTLQPDAAPSVPVQLVAPQPNPVPAPSHTESAPVERVESPDFDEEEMRERYRIPRSCGIVPPGSLYEDTITISLKPGDAEGTPLRVLRNRFPLKSHIPFVIVDDREIYFADEVGRIGSLDPNRIRYYLARNGRGVYLSDIRPRARVSDDPHDHPAPDLSGGEQAMERQMGVAGSQRRAEAAPAGRPAPAGSWAKPTMFASAAAHIESVEIKHPGKSAEAGVFSLLYAQRPQYKKAVDAANAPPSAPAAAEPQTAIPAPAAAPAKDAEKKEAPKEKDAKKAS